MGRGLCVDGECECGSNPDGLNYGGTACEELLCSGMKIFEQRTTPINN